MTIRPRQFALTVNMLLVAAVFLLGGCLERPLKPLNPCLVSGVVATVSVTNIDKVDLLFMVDNSGSMTEEQVALRDQFPKLVRVLTTGDKDGDGRMDFPPAKDLHLGVVSSDMGLIALPDTQGASLRCPGRGDDGLLLHMSRDPTVQGCQADYAPFLTYRADINNPMQTATDFGCIASLGTMGCGFEQQLEAPLKALSPSLDAKGLPSQLVFLGPNGTTTTGHGDLENNGFLRNDPVQGLSLIAIVIVSDEEDCSSQNEVHFTPTADIPPNDPLRSKQYYEHPNLRCWENPDNLWPVKRYIDGFKALRVGNENLVIFAGIVGVPPDLVTPDKLAAVDFTNTGESDGFYDRILMDARMTETVDTATTMMMGAGNLRPSCMTATGRAYPPRRIVSVAKGFGANSVIQSICQSDFGPALDAIINVIARQLGAVCLPRTLVRNSDGKVGCNVVWELPNPQTPHEIGTPTECSALEFLMDPGTTRARVGEKGGAICTVAQLAVVNKLTMPTVTDGTLYMRGWYYDDFSPSVMSECTGSSKQRIAFSTDATPPTGVTVRLECLNETQTLTNTRVDLLPNIEQPSVGDPCRDVMLNGMLLTDDAACAVRLSRPTTRWTDGIDRSMFCHPSLNVCVLHCDTTADCPPAWVCDDRPTTLATSRDQKICVNPTCGDLK